jgi:hypothetical protein
MGRDSLLLEPSYIRHNLMHYVLSYVFQTLKQARRMFKQQIHCGEGTRTAATAQTEEEKDDVNQTRIRTTKKGKKGNGEKKNKNKEKKDKDREAKIALGLNKLFIRNFYEIQLLTFGFCIN